jgi:hypothetical protein
LSQGVVEQVRLAVVVEQGALELGRVLPLPLETLTQLQSAMVGVLLLLLLLSPMVVLVATLQLLVHP